MDRICLAVIAAALGLVLAYGAVRTGERIAKSEIKREAPAELAVDQ